MPSSEKPWPPPSTVVMLPLNAASSRSALGFSKMMRSVPPIDPDPNSVPCGPRSTSARSTSNRRKSGVLPPESEVVPTDPETGVSS